MTVPQEATIGVAVAIPEPFAAELNRSREQLGDPLASAIPAHITLLPPTGVTIEQLPVVEAHLRAVAADLDPFDVELAGAGTFRPISPVVFVQVATGADGCARLERGVRAGPLAQEPAFPYHPHVTVAHNLDEPALERAQQAMADYAASFRVDTFSVYLQGQDAVWRPFRSFLLGGRPPQGV